VIIYYFADPLSRKDQQNKSALQQMAKGAKGREHGAESVEQRA